MPTMTLSRLSRAERRSLGGMTTVIVLLHLVGWGLLALVASQHLSLGAAGVFGLGLGVTAYTLGLRHAFDADHIAAIDNVTRKLMTDRRDGPRPLSVGFWFSLGHSSVVVVLCLLLAAGMRAIGAQVADDSSSLQQATGVIGTSVSGLFLITIGIINAGVLIGILRVARGMRAGDFDEAELEHHLHHRGLLNRLLARFTGSVTKPVHMYPVGLLFGLGFDTATEVSLLALAAGAATLQLPWYALLILPILFTAGMSAFDSLDGAFMGLAYDWAFLNPARKVFYNVTMTGLSVVVALVIGGIEIVGLLGSRLGIETGPVAWISAIDLDHVGYAIVGLFALTWLVAVAVWRLGRIEERWSGPGAQ
jgi:high-affinity nickel-transport protein